MSHSVNSDGVLAELNRVCQFVSSSTGVRFDLDRNRVTGQQQIDRDRRAYKFRLYFKDLLGPKDHVDISVRLDVTEFDRLMLPAQDRRLIHPYSDADACSTSIRCIKLEEALADKLKCLIQRRYCYDIFDLVYGAFLGREIQVDRSEMMRVFFRKTIFGSSPLAAKRLLLDLPLDLFRGYWGKVLVPAPSRLSFDEAISHLHAGVESLFERLPSGGGMANAFFPSRLRNPILQAASERMLLRVTYDGIPRLVEPYALTFKRRQSDGKGHEYLYVFDRTGGRRGPGIKAFFAHKIQRLEVSDTPFIPRFEIQLAKAGDASQTGVFRGNPGPRSGVTTRTRKRKSAAKFVVECHYCGKRFDRTTSSTRMNDHKDPYGNKCYGRSGFVVAYR